VPLAMGEDLADSEQYPGWVNHVKEVSVEVRLIVD